MATQLFLLDTLASTHRATNSALLNGSATPWTPRSLGVARGSGVLSASGTPVTGPTNGVEVTVSAFPAEWLSEPVAADVTISGTITANIWGFEQSMNDNVAINVVIDIVRSDSSNTIVQIVKSTRVTELAVGSSGVNNFTTGMASGGYTGQTLNRGDRLRIRVFGDDVGTMAAGIAQAWCRYNGTTAAADGDSYVTFTENITFESAPGGTVIYLTDTASDVATASVDREAWTSRGAGVQTDVTNTAAGFTSPIQVTDTAGGTVVDWFTKQLQAVTLTGMAVGNIRALEAAAAANASIRCEIARVASDGTSPTVWASWCMSANNGRTGELNTSEAAETVNVSGDDLAITDGQRLRIRLYIDDYPLIAMGASQTVTTYYAGTSAAASGDTYITFPVTLTEFVSSTPGPASSRRQRRASRFLTFR
jgi:hypothetical protein